jgi:tRNA pseudouridine55 synthase
VDGFLLVDKPAGATSHDVVARVRRALRERGVSGATRRGPRVGHAGTLDPFATGLLVVLVGRATRAQADVMRCPKSYEAVARFGATSTTGDPDGEITVTGRVPDGELALPVGELRQRPPAYSAVKVGGRRAYALARAGEAVELRERTIRVTRFEELWRDGPRRGFAIDCSSGTYVRSLIAELGDAYCETLRRTAIGPFALADAGPPEDVDRLLGLGEGLGRMLETRLLAGDAARAAASGRPVPGHATGRVLLVDAAGPIAIAEAGERGLLRPVVGFRGGP